VRPQIVTLTEGEAELDAVFAANLRELGYGG
jgi:hypothetical protein